jgi:hypothetical protein
MVLDHSNAIDIAMPQKGPDRPYYAIATTAPRWRKDRHAAIAEAVYFRAERRGFAPGHELSLYHALSNHSGGARIDFKVRRGV